MDASSSLSLDALDYTRARFEDFARQKDEALDAALGAALLARDVYPELDVAGVLRKLEALAAPLVGAGLERETAEVQATRLADLLFGMQTPAQGGFRGNESEYYDPRNSLLPDVLERRTGIPLTLAIVYCDVARRLGVPAHGVGFPGHFLVRIERPLGQEPLFVDPFFGGRVLGEADLRTRLTRTLGKGSETTDLAAHLHVAPARAILVRMLTNLKAIYLTRNERARAHLALDRITSLLPNAAGPLMERGLLALQLGAAASAKSDLARALSLQPTDSEERRIRAELEKLSKSKSSSALN